MYTVDHPFGYHSKSLSSHAHGTEFRGRKFKDFETSEGGERIGMVGHWLARSQMSGSDPRTGTFHETQVTIGDTASSVNGV